SLGVTLWELFENAARPYSDFSDREVLTHVIKEKQVKLFKPCLDQPYSDRWYEVLQFCWLPPEQRPTAEEVHRLLTYLRMQSQRDSEIDFEQQWNALKPNTSNREINNSAFPILDHFTGDRLGHEMEEVLTVTETSQGLSFEYIWEAAKHDHFDECGHVNPDEAMTYTSIFFPVEVFERSLSEQGSGAQDESGQEASLAVPGVLPVFDAHKLSVGNDYYIQLEEKGSGCSMNFDNQSVVLTTEVDHQEAVQEKSSHVTVLRDLDVEESSTDGDFFHYNTDPKEEFLSTTGSPESPFQNIFNDIDRSEELTNRILGFSETNDIPKELKLAVLNSDTDARRAVGLSEKEQSSHVSENETDSLCENISNQSDFVTLEECSDNFLFLQEKNLLTGLLSKKTSSDFGQKTDNVLKSVLETSNRNSVEPEPVLAENAQVFPLIHESLRTVKDENFNPVIMNNDSNSQSQTTVEMQASTAFKSCDKCTDLPYLKGEGKLLNVDVNKFASCNIDTPCQEELSSNAKNNNLGHNPCYSVAVEADECDAQIKQGMLFKSDEIAFNREKCSHQEDMKRNLQEKSPLLKKDECLLEERQEISNNFENCKLVPEEVTLISVAASDSTSQGSLLEDSSSPVQSVEQALETPDSLDSLDVNEVLESLQAQSPQKLLPPDKPADSGYETENLESPEWTSHITVEDASSVDTALCVVSNSNVSALPSNPVIIVSEAASLDAVNSNFEITPKVFLGGNQNSYRDSAYFSDNDSEPDKKTEETVNLSTEMCAVSSNRGENSTEEDDSFEERQKCDVRNYQDTNDQNAKLELSHNLEIQEMSVRMQRCPDEWADATLNSLEISMESNLKDEVKLSETSHKTVSCVGTNTSELLSHRDLKSVHNMNSPLDLSNSEKSFYHTEGQKLKEPDIEGKYLGKLDVSGMLDLEDGDDADEEDENSDSEDDMRTFNMHSLSSDSEDETVHQVPEILTDRDDGKHLRSLLKLPKPLNERQHEHWKNEKKAVTFFDDVTVYLFDQETPTKELGNRAADLNGEDSGSTPVPSSSFSYLNRFANSESSTDEEGGGFEWDDDFSSPEPSFISKAANSLIGSKPPLQSSKYFSPPPPSRTLDQNWSHSSPYSRFSISPANIASFSLTHLTDSDIEQGG
ncbi:LMTK2 kinase, partial [Alcedo cyanopectus]|nr:LMTK2 kinase [Ceyx cyanopectus]